MARRIEHLERLLDEARRDYMALQRENWLLVTKLARERKWSDG